MATSLDRMKAAAFEDEHVTAVEKATGEHDLSLSSNHHDRI